MTLGDIQAKTLTNQLAVVIASTRILGLTCAAHGSQGQRVKDLAGGMLSTGANLCAGISTVP